MDGKVNLVLEENYMSGGKIYQGPETLEELTEDLDNYFIRLMDPVMACLQEPDHNTEHTPMGEMDGGSVSPLGASIGIEEKEEKTLGGEKDDGGACRTVDEGTQTDKQEEIHVVESKEISKNWEVPKGCLEFMGKTLRGLFPGSNLEEFVRVVRDRFPDCPSEVCKE